MIYDRSRFDSRYCRPNVDPRPDGYERISVKFEGRKETILVAAGQCGHCGGARHSRDCTGLCKHCKRGRVAAAPEPAPTGAPSAKTVSVDGEFIGKVWDSFDDAKKLSAIAEVLPALHISIRHKLVEAGLKK